MIFSSLSLANSNIGCIDNETLEVNNSVLYNNTWYNFTEITNCKYGCDDKTLTCSPPEYIQTLGVIIIFIIICGVILYLSAR
jgi:hypothetical protein